MLDYGRDSYNSYPWILALVLNSTLGSFSFGYSLGVFNPVQAIIASINSWEQEDANLGIITSFLPLGAMFGAILAGPLSSLLGRNKAMIVADLVFIAGSIVGLFNELTTLLLFRILTGIAVGINSVIVPLYISEMAPKEISGRMGSFTQFVLNIGILSAFLMGLYLPNKGNDDDSSIVQQNWWRVMFIIPCVSSVIRAILLLIFFPFDTPKSLLDKKREDEAHFVANKIYKPDASDEFISQLEKEIKESSDYTYFALLSSRQSTRVMVAIMLNIIQQFSGINVIVFYSYNVFKGESDPGESLNSKLFSIVSSLILIFSAYLSGHIADKFGRKRLLEAGEVSCILCLSILAVMLVFEHYLISRYLLLVFLFCFGVSLGPIVWLYTPEIVNSKGCSVAGLANWFACFLSSLIFFPIKNAIGLSGVYFMHAAFGATGLVYFLLFVKETKGLSDELIEKAYYKEKETEEFKED